MLIQSILCFIAGVSTALFFLVLLGPLLWRQMRYLARRAFYKNQRIHGDLALARNFVAAQHGLQMAQKQRQLELVIQQNAEQQKQIYKLHQERKGLKEFYKEKEKLQQQIDFMTSQLQEFSYRQDIAYEQIQQSLFSEKLMRLDLASQTLKAKDIEEKPTRLAQFSIN